MRIQLQDDGNGKLISTAGLVFGTIDYATGKALLRPVNKTKIPKPVYQKKILNEIIEGGGLRDPNVTIKQQYRWEFIGYESIEVGAQLPLQTRVMTQFFGGQSAGQRNKTLQPPDICIEVESDAPIVPSTLSASSRRGYYRDDNGKIRLTDNNNDHEAGRMDYANRRLILKPAYYEPRGFEIIALGTSYDLKGVDALSFLLPVSPIRAGSFGLTVTAMDGSTIRVGADNRGNITGTGVSGVIDYQYGYVRIYFDKLVYAQTARFNAVSYGYLPLDTSILGIDATRLPANGLVPIYRIGDMVVIANHAEEEIGSAFVGGQVVQLSRQDIDGLCLVDADGKGVESSNYELDPAAGTIKFARNLNLSGYRMPLKAKHTQEEANRLTGIDIDGTLTLMFPTGRDYPVANTYVSSALIAGDLAVRASAPFYQKHWDGVWKDEATGSTIRNRLNLTDFPFALTDAGAISSRWAIVFFDQDHFDLYAEVLGFVGRFGTVADLAPLNPSSNKPYFTLPKGAFGSAQTSGWAAGDCVRFDTFGTHIGVWVLRAVQPTPHKYQGKSGFQLCLYGDTVEV